MPSATNEVIAPAPPVFMRWGVPTVVAGDSVFGTSLLWLTGGASLLLWTAIALLLTSA